MLVQQGFLLYQALVFGTGRPRPLFPIRASVSQRPVPGWVSGCRGCAGVNGAVTDPLNQTHTALVRRSWSNNVSCQRLVDGGKESVYNAETDLLNDLLVSMIPDEDAEPPPGLVQLAAEFWIENHSHVGHSTVLPVLSSPALPPETAERIVKLGNNSDLLSAYLARNDPAEFVARRIHAADTLALKCAASKLQTFHPTVSELLVDVGDVEMLLALGANLNAPMMCRLRALLRAYSMPAPSPRPYGYEDHKPAALRIADAMFERWQMKNGDTVVAVLRLLQDSPEMLSALETAIAGSTDPILTDEAVALLRWSSKLTMRRGTTCKGWRGSDRTRTAVFGFLSSRFGTHTASWDMFAKLASPDQTIGETVALVLEVETPDK